jgi:hypothetical protein
MIFSEARDVIAAMLFIGAAIALILGFSPVQPWFIVTAVLLLAIGGSVAKHRRAALIAAIFVLGVRFLFAFALGRDWRMLAGALVCAAGIYFSVKLDPSLLDEAD